MASTLAHQLPVVPGITLAARYLPSRSTEIGGDWYDALQLPDGKLVLTVGDVMGKGLAAAAGMRVGMLLRLSASSQFRNQAAFPEIGKSHKITGIVYLAAAGPGVPGPIEDLRANAQAR